MSLADRLTLLWTWPVLRLHASLANWLTLLWTWPTPWPPQVHSPRHRTTADRSAVLPSNCRATICRWAHASHMGAVGASP